MISLNLFRLSTKPRGDERTRKKEKNRTRIFPIQNF